MQAAAEYFCQDLCVTIIKLKSSCLLGRFTIVVVAEWRCSKQSDRYKNRRKKN